MMKTNDIKKGMRVQLTNGWYGTMKDNARGNTRMVEVDGFFKEIGSVYAHDIAVVLTASGWVPVYHTDAQMNLRNRVKAIGF